MKKVTIEIVVKDEQGNKLNCENQYEVELEGTNFDHVEKAVSQLKKKSLPEIQKAILIRLQNEFSPAPTFVRNGTREVCIKTENGSFFFNLQRFFEPSSARHTDYFELTGQMIEGYISNHLKEFVGYYSLQMGYKAVAGLVERHTGEAQLSAPKIQQIVTDKAVKLSCEQQTKAQTILSIRCLPKINSEVDIYDAKGKEILLFDDNIQVKEQKSKRNTAKSQTEKHCESKSVSKPRTKVNNTIVALQKQDNSFKYLTTPITQTGHQSIPLNEVIQSQLIEQYQQSNSPLNMVAITDGAKDIRARLLATFMIPIVIILDWYHLVKKVNELMSMIARNKPEKIVHLKFIFPKLWHGEVQAVLNYLQNEVEVRNAEKHLELISYLQKHIDEIIDYERRKKAGKTIGSGLIEKTCDQVVGYRQKNKGMSWSPLARSSLAILKVALLNNEWEQIWFPEIAINDTFFDQAANDFDGGNVVPLFQVVNL